MLKLKQWLPWNLVRPKHIHSLDHLRYLHQLLSKNQVVNKQNCSLLVETLRRIAEILIWGDQNDSSVFDFFLEKGMLSFFLDIMTQECENSVCVQLLQTLNILFENMRNETSLYYLLSNNHVNSIIVYKFDFTDEEVLAYYVSFLKTLSFKLNTHTIHFFFNEHTYDFPLYTEAIKFFNHKEKMVRIAIRTLTLNVFKVDEDSMLKFVEDRTAGPYFSNLVYFIGKHVIEFDEHMSEEIKDQQKLILLDDLVAEHLDHLHYLNDIFELKIMDLNSILTRHLNDRLLVPLYIYSLAPNASENQKRPKVAPIVAFFLLSQAFLIITHVPLVQILIHTIINAKPPLTETPLFEKPLETLEESLIHNLSLNESQKQDATDQDSIELEDDSDMTLSERRESLPLEGVGGSAVVRSISYTETIDEYSSSTSTTTTSEHTFWDDRPFLNALYEALERAERDDHTSIFSLCLIYAIVFNAGVTETILLDKVVPRQTETDFIINHLGATRLLDTLTNIIQWSCKTNSTIRLVTLELSIQMLVKICFRKNRKFMMNYHFAKIEQAMERSEAIIRDFYQNETDTSLFLDLFEDEYREFCTFETNVEFLMQDTNLLLPPSQLSAAMMSGLDFTRRLPCDDYERLRYAICAFFSIRRLNLLVKEEEETQLPICKEQNLFKKGSCIDLTNCDLIACYVTMDDDQSKQRRFMVVTDWQLIIIEPDSQRLGWGVAKYGAELQHIDVNADKNDSRTLLIKVLSNHSRSKKNASQNMPKTLKCVFDDHIRSVAAKNRLSKGKKVAKQTKLSEIAKLINYPIDSESTGSSPSESKRPSRSDESHKTDKSISPKEISIPIPGGAVASSSQVMPETTTQTTLASEKVSTVATKSESEQASTVEPAGPVESVNPVNPVDNPTESEPTPSTSRRAKPARKSRTTVSTQAKRGSVPKKDAPTEVTIPMENVSQETVSKSESETKEISDEHKPQLND